MTYPATEAMPARRRVPTNGGRLSQPVLMLLAMGFGAAVSTFVTVSQFSGRPAVSPEAFTVVTHDQKQATLKVAADLAALSARLDTLTQTLPRGRNGDDTRALRAQIERMDAQIERIRADLGGTVAPLLHRLEQVDRQQRETSAKLATTTEKLDQIERQLLTTGSIPR